MAKKRRKQHRSRNPSQRAGTRTTERPRPGGPEDAEASSSRPEPARRNARTESSRSRAEKKELARQERERARRRVARTLRVRRAVRIGALVGVVGVGAFLLFRVGAPGSVSAEALEVGRAAGCSDVQTPAGSAPGGQHLGAGESGAYTERPASSGFHAPAPLPSEPSVHTQPISEEAAVHNLEHGFVLLYYRAEGDQALPSEVVDRLARIAEREDKVLLAPYPQLDETTSLAIVAWNKLWECPATIEAADAATIATSFIEAYRGTSNAPEGGV